MSDEDEQEAQHEPQPNESPADDEVDDFELASEEQRERMQRRRSSRRRRLTSRHSSNGGLGGDPFNLGPILSLLRTFRNIADDYPTFTVITVCSVIIAASAYFIF